jgi:hypothetical protein
MELAFNELSCQPYANDFTACYSRIEQFVKTYKAAEAHGFRGVRFQPSFDQIPLAENYSLADFCNDSHASTRTLVEIMLSIRRYPFIDDDSEEEKRYVQNNFFLLKNEERFQVYGLAVACLYQTAAIGFYSEIYRDTVLFSVKIEGDEEGCVSVISVSKPEHFEKKEFIDWKQQTSKIHLTECNTPASGKQISLRNDHGKDVLLNFSKRLVQSPYVVEIVNSLPYNSNEKKFIRKIKPDGLIEIVLINTDKGLGLAVKTTGRNYNETKAIAQILQEEFHR